MKPKKIKQLRQLITSTPHYTKARLARFSYDAAWWREEYVITGDKYARENSDRYFKKAQWYKNQIDKTPGNPFYNDEERLSIHDLMVGDWVRIKSTGEIIKIVIIDGSEKTISYFNENTEKIITLSIDNISPILLSPEILEENGFKYKRIPLIAELGWRRDGIFLYTDGVVVSGKHNCMKTIYVHQLQHFIHAHAKDSDEIVITSTCDDNLICDVN